MKGIGRKGKRPFITLTSFVGRRGACATNEAAANPCGRRGREGDGKKEEEEKRHCGEEVCGRPGEVDLKKGKKLGAP